MDRFKNVLNCRTEFNPANRKAPVRTVCYHNGKRYSRKMNHRKGERQNVRDISDYILKRGGEIENIVYPDIGMG